METEFVSYEEYWGYYWRVTSRHRIPGIFDYDRNLTDLIEARCGLKPGASILDLGCAGGDQAKLFARKGYRITGIDKVPALIAYAKGAFESEGLSGVFNVGDFRDLDFREEFDLCVMLSGTFGMTNEQENEDLLERIFRALKPNGQAFIDYLPVESNAGRSLTRNWYPLEEGYALREEWFDVPSSTYRTTIFHILDEGRIIRDSDETGSGANEIIRCYGHREIELLAEKHGFTVKDHLSRKLLDQPDHVPDPGEPRGMLILQKPA